MPNDEFPAPSRSILLQVAAWWGFVAGLIEGIGLLVLQHYKNVWKGVSLEIVWISAFLNLFLFLLVGLVLAWVIPSNPRQRTWRISVFVFAFLTFADWLALTKVIGPLAIIFLGAGLATVLRRWFDNHVASTLQFWTKTLSWVATCGVLTFVCIQGGLWLQERVATNTLPAARQGLPNILIIVVDTLRADHLSGYGYSRPTSPKLDRITEQGVAFENAIATSSWTLPSHASLLTGRYPYEHHAEVNRYDGRYPSLAQVLKERGYRTAAFSGNNFYFSRLRGFGPGFLHFEDYFYSVGDSLMRTVWGRLFERYVPRFLNLEEVPARKWANDVNRSALRWIDRDPTIPFLVFLNYYDVHDPYTPPQPYRTRFSRLSHPGGIVHSDWDRYPKMTPVQLQGEVDAYDGAIAFVDDQIAELFADLKVRSLDEDTLVVITSDHGECFGDHDMLGHGNALYRELIRVPLIFLLPGKVPAAFRVKAPVSLASVPATIMDLIGAGDQTVFPGPSLAPYWSGRSPDRGWPDALSELVPNRKELAAAGPIKSVLNSRWHYIEAKRAIELFDWVEDSKESTNLANTPAGRPVALDLASRIRELTARTRHAGYHPASSDAEQALLPPSAGQTHTYHGQLAHAASMPAW